MIPSALELGLTLGLPWLVGAALLSAFGIGWRTDRLAFAGHAYAVGALATAAVVGLWLAAPGASRDPTVPVLALASIAVAGWFAGGRTPRLEGAREPASPWFLGAVALALLLGAGRILFASLMPVLYDDEANFWSFNAKLLFQAGGFGEDFAAAIQAPVVRNADYPLFNTLLQTWTFVNAGELTHVANRLPIQGFVLAQTLVLASALRRVARPIVAGAVLLVVVAAGEGYLQATKAQSDLLVGFGALLALDAWWRWRAEGARGHAFLACAGLAISAWSKNEGLLLIVALALAAVVVRPRLERPAARLWPWLSLPLAVLASSAWLRWRYDLGNDFLAHPKHDATIVSVFVSEAPARLPQLIRFYAQRFLFDVGTTNGVLHAFLFAVVLLPERWREREVALPAVALAVASLGVIVVFLGAPNALDWHLATGAVRVHFQLVPVAALLVARVVCGRASRAETETREARGEPA
ncbi:MAG: hypothetical protein WD226_09625, partial [Planctomycetota bacterium]